MNTISDWSGANLYLDDESLISLNYASTIFQQWFLREQISIKDNTAN